MLKLDKDTQKVLDDGFKIAEFVKTDAWQAVKKMYVKKIIEADSISKALSESSLRKLSLLGDKLILGVMANAKAAEICLNWLTEVEGAASQFKVNQDLLLSEQEDGIFAVFPERSSEETIISNNG